MLEGRVIVVAAGGTALDAPLAAGLADAGADVVVVGPAATTIASAPPADRTSVTAMARPVSSREEMTAALDAVIAARGPLAGIVHTGTGVPVPEPVTGCDDETWDRRCEAPVRAALACAQAAFDRLGGGALVYVTPTVTLTGAAGLVPYVTALEAVRALAKSAARQWGERAVTVNCVAPALGAVAPDAAAADPAVAEAALGRVPDPRGDVAPVVAWLLSPLAHAVTGATITVDGGVVMAP